MIWPYLIAATLSAGWMLSPDVLVRLGNGVAENRTLYLAGLALSALCSALAVSIIRHPALRHNGRSSQTGMLVQGIGRVPAMSLLLASRTSLVALLPTGLLVTAGFAFNEVFLYWFPNFGFAFLLLGLITLLHLIGDHFAMKTQPFFAGIMLCAMAILCLAGLGGAASKPISVDIGFSFSMPVFTGALLLFLGFDYITPPGTNDSRFPAFGALFFTLLLFVFWSMLSLQYVGAEKLSSSTIPYMLTAREILGQPGRYLMGIAVISGVCAAVNGIFHLAAGTFSELSERHLLPGHPAGRLRRRRFILVFAVIIGAFMMGGLAGHDILESYIQASLLLWLLLISFQCLAAWRLLKQNQVREAWQGLMLALIFFACVIYLALSHNHSAVIIRFILLTTMAAAGISTFWLWKKPAYEVTYPTTTEHRGGH